MVSRFLSNMANYDGGMAPNVEQMKEEEDGGKKKAKVSFRSSPSTCVPAYPIFNSPYRK